MAIHVAVTRRVRPGREAEFQDALREFFQTSFGQKSVLGASMIVPPPGVGSREFGILRTFVDEAQRDAFYSSPMFLDWDHRVKEFTEGDPEIRELTGLEAWFRNSDGPPPPLWKMALLTWVAVWPVTYQRSEAKALAVVREIEAAGGKAVAFAANTADPQAVRASIDRTVAELGGLDILVNNAAIASWSTVEEISLEDIDALLNVNVRGVILACQAAIPHLGEGGRIINIGSIAGERVLVPGVTVYAATKSALRSLTAGLSRDLGPRGVTVNLVQPGSTDTEMNPADGEHAAAQLGNISLGRFGKPEDIAAAVVYLAGPGAKQITGTTITVDGGAIA